MEENNHHTDSRCVFGEMHTDEGVHPMEITLSRSPSSDFGDVETSTEDSEDDSSSDDSDCGSNGGIENDCDCDECKASTAENGEKNDGESKPMNKDRMNMYALNWRATKAPSEV